MLFRSVMSIGTRSLAVLGAFVITCSGLWPASATTTIGFDGLSLADGDEIPTLFASRVQTDGPGYTVSMGRLTIGTPDIWVGLSEYTFRSDWDGRGAVAQINPQYGPGYWGLFLVFVTDINYGAIVLSFDLDLHSGAGPVDVDWSFNANGFNASGNWQRTTPGRDTITPEYNFYGGIPPSTDHFFSFRINAGDPGSIAIDNITFDLIVVPEPSILVLAMFGGITAAAFRRAITRPKT